MNPEATLPVLPKHEWSASRDPAKGAVSPVWAWVGGSGRARRRGLPAISGYAFGAPGMEFTLL